MFIVITPKLKKKYTLTSTCIIYDIGFKQRTRLELLKWGGQNHCYNIIIQCIYTREIISLIKEYILNKSTNINHKGLQRTANEYAGKRRIYKDLISKNEM